MQLFESMARWFSDIPVVRRIRHGRRVIVEAPAQLRIAGDDIVRTVQLRDMSISGARISTDVRLSRGMTVRLHADGDGGKTFDVVASVVEERRSDREGQNDFGLRFVELSLPSARTLAAFVSSRLATSEMPFGRNGRRSPNK